MLQLDTSSIANSSVIFYNFDSKWIENVNINQFHINEEVKRIISSNIVNYKPNKAAWLLKAITCIDLTTLAGDDTKSNVLRLCYKAANPLPECYYRQLGFTDPDFVPLTTAAVCVYPSRVSDAAQAIYSMNLSTPISIAAVATGFPTGQYGLETRLQEITFAIQHGASEIDVVIDRSLVLIGNWKMLYEELVEMRKVCGKVHLKVILAVGELATMENIYKASMVAMYAGSDFIKTSTGKEGVNATLPVGLVMCRAIKDFYVQTGIKVGLKPAGGLRTCQDAINWLMLIKTQLGDEWLSPQYFRIGASGLLGDIEKWFHENLNNKVSLASKFSFI